MSDGSSAVPPLPPGWRLTELSKIARINPALDCPSPGDEDDVNFVPMRAVEPEGGGVLRPEIRLYGEVKKGYTAFQSGDVIMAKITPCMENGKTTVVPDLPGTICFGSTEFHVLRAENGIEPKWLANFLLQHEVRRAAQRKMTGGVGQMRVPASFLQNASIPIAPSAEQQRITVAVDELLSDADAGVAALQRVEKRLAHYRAAVLKAAVEGGLTEFWRRHHTDVEPASSTLQQILAERRRIWEQDQLRKFTIAGKEPPKTWRAKYKEPVESDPSKLPQLPTGWIWASLDQLSVFVTSGSRGWKEYYAPEGALFVRSQDIRTDRLVLDSTAHVRPPKNREGSRTEIHHGDLLVTITGANVAKAALVNVDICEAYVSQHVGLIRLVDPQLGDFVHTYAVAPSGGRKRLLAAAYGAGKPGLNLDNLRELPVPLPPRSEWEVIVDMVNEQLSVVQHLEDDLKTKKAITEALRQAILRHAFTGQLVPQDQNDEPVSELLGRVADEREMRARQTTALKRRQDRSPACTRSAAARN